MFVERARDQRAVDQHRRQSAPRRGCRSRSGRPGRCGTARRPRRRAPAASTGAQARGRRRGEARELGRDLPQQPHLREDRRHAAVEHRRQRLAAIGVHAAQVLGRQLDRRQRVLDLVRDLPRHLGPRLEPVRAFELAALRLQLGGHAVEGVDQPPQLVGRLARRSRASKSPRAIRRVARVSRLTGSAMRSAIESPIAGAEQDEEQRAEVHAAIELVDLALDLALPVGERHRQDRRRGRRRAPAPPRSCRRTVPMRSSPTKLGSRSSTIAR